MSSNSAQKYLDKAYMTAYRIPHLANKDKPGAIREWLVNINQFLTASRVKSCT